MVKRPSARAKEEVVLVYHPGRSRVKPPAGKERLSVWSITKDWKGLV
jgi:hypothetical protein